MNDSQAGPLFSWRTRRGTLTLYILPFLLLQLSVLLVFTTHFSWLGLGICLVSYGVRMFAITGFYHRYFSHRTYKMGRLMQFVAAVWGATATQKGALWWAAHHRVHHRASDTSNDPHNAREGFWHAHWLWFLYDESAHTDLEQIPELARFPELRIVDRFWYVPPIALGVGLFAVGGWHWVVWGYFVSTFLLSNATYTINSLMHYWGRQQYYTGDDSRNHWLLALITLGEGWHNNHHRYQASTRNGFFRGEFDITYWVLKAFSLVGLVRDLTPVPDKILEEGRLNRHRRHSAAAAGAAFAPQRVPLSELLAEMPVRSRGLVADTLQRVREDMQVLRGEIGKRGAQWRGDLDELRRQIGFCGAVLAEEGPTNATSALATGDWHRTLSHIGERCALLRTDWQEMSDSVAVRGQALRDEVEVLGARVSERGRQLYGEVEALRGALGDATQRLAIEMESLRAQVALALAQVQRDGAQREIERTYADAVHSLHVEVEALCEMAAEKKRRWGREFDAWGQLLPRMA